MFTHSRLRHVRNTPRRGAPWQRLSAALGLALVVLAACEPPPTPLTRTATVREVTNVVMARAASDAELAAAGEGFVVGSGGQVQTEAEARAKLVLNDGIIIRLAPDTLLANDSPSTQWKFRLESGKVWISLFGGALVMDTPLGSITIFGNSVEFEFAVNDPATTADDVLTIQCLQGSCRFQDGRSDIQLNDLEQLVVTNNGESVSRLELASKQLEEFIANNPETAGILAALRLSAPKVTGTAVVVQVPTLAFFALATLESEGTILPPTLTRRPPTSTLRFATLPPPASPTQPPPSSGGSNSTPTLRPPTGGASPTPQSFPGGPTATRTPTFTPITPTATVPTRTPPPTKTPVPPTDTDTPVLPPDTDTPVPPPDTDTPIPTDTDTPVPVPPSDTPDPTP